MKIRIRTNLGRIEYPSMPWQCGEVHEVDEALGSSLIARGVAKVALKPCRKRLRPCRTNRRSPNKKPGISGKK